MFFTAELLSRRDSGFGLLWLAATLGAKSSFKKLPRRSVTSADIVQLCNLIADPPEPLALRLSSNLMIGAARVYKVKQEIFLADVTTCFTTIKKAVDDIRMSTTVDLQMAQSSVRPDTVTVRADPSAAFALEFEHLFPEWDKYHIDGTESDDEYKPATNKKRQKKGKETPMSHIGEARGNLHTLNESYDLLLSQSFDMSYRENGIMGVSSSQAGFVFEENFLGELDEGNDIGDELARELGADWGVPEHHRASSVGQEMDRLITDPSHKTTGLLPEDSQANAGVDEDIDMSMNIDMVEPNVQTSVHFTDAMHPETDAEQRTTTATQFEEERVEKPGKQPKRIRLLLDNRTELTNEELQRARTLYMEEQAQIRHEMNEKKAQKEGEILLNEMILGAPCGLHTPVLIDFWLENFRVQVEARSGQLIFDTEGQPPRKRRRLGLEGSAESRVGLAAPENDHQFYQNAEFGDFPIYEYHGDADSKLRSSEEPGQARRMSRPPSVPGSHMNLYGQPAEASVSQRSAVFPWDNAGGVSSSAAGNVSEMAGNDRFSVSMGRAQRGSSRGSRSRRESPMFHAPGSPAGLTFGDPQMDGDGFEFSVGEAQLAVLESQQSDVNIMALERHSLDFLEYCKIQSNAFSSRSGSVDFDDIVPASTSTAHVAAAAFYHCLVLATKDLLRLDQGASFSAIRITVK